MMGAVEPGIFVMMVEANSSSWLPSDDSPSDNSSIGCCESLGITSMMADG